VGHSRVTRSRISVLERSVGNSSTGERLRCVETNWRCKQPPLIVGGTKEGRSEPA